MAKRGKVWWAATADFKAVHIGKVRRRHLWEQVTFLLLASGEEEARSNAHDIAKAKEYCYEVAISDLVSWQFIELVDLKELIDQKFIPGMEVNWKFFEYIDSLKAESGD